MEHFEHKFVYSHSISRHKAKHSGNERHLPPSREHQRQPCLLSHYWPLAQQQNKAKADPGQPHACGKHSNEKDGEPEVFPVDLVCTLLHFQYPCTHHLQKLEVEKWCGWEEEEIGKH